MFALPLFTKLPNPIPSPFLRILRLKDSIFWLVDTEIANCKGIAPPTLMLGLNGVMICPR